STTAPTLVTLPGIAASSPPTSTVAASPFFTAARSSPNSCAITHIFDVSATVKQGVEPAASNWPGAIDFSTTVPAIGARITPWPCATGLPSRIAAMVCGSTCRASSACNAASRSASAPVASDCACACSRCEIAWCAYRSRSVAANWSAACAAASALRYAPTAAAKSGESTRASGCPALTLSPGFSSTSVTGPENGASTWVARSWSKSTTPLVSMLRWKLLRAIASRWMCSRWAEVSVTFCGVSAAVVACGSAFDEQAATDINAARASTGSSAAAIRRVDRATEGSSLFIAIPGGSGVGWGGQRGGPAFGRGVMPPAAAECLEQRGRVGVATRLRLHQRDARLLVALLRTQQGQVACIAILVLALRQIQGELGGLRGRGRGLQALGVVLQGRQRIGHVLERGQHGGAIFLGRLHVGRLGGALLMQQAAAMENRRGDIGADAPEARTGLEHLAYRHRGTAGICAEGDIRQPIRDGHADIGAGRVHVRLGLAHVRTLRHQSGWQAQRQVLRQVQTGQVESLLGCLARQAPGQHGQQVVLLIQLGQQRRQRRLELGQL